LKKGLKKTKSAIFSFKKSTKKFLNKLPGGHSLQKKQTAPTYMITSTENAAKYHSTRPSEIITIHTPTIAYESSAVQPSIVLNMHRDSSDLGDIRETSDKLEILNKIIYGNAVKLVGQNKDLEMLESKTQDLNHCSKEYANTTKKLVDVYKKNNKRDWCCFHVSLICLILFSLLLFYFVYKLTSYIQSHYGYQNSYA